METSCVSSSTCSPSTARPPLPFPTQMHQGSSMAQMLFLVMGFAAAPAVLGWGVNVHADVGATTESLNTTGEDANRPFLINEPLESQNGNKIPSPRCENREEWQGMCRVWSGRSHHRYLELVGWTGGRRSGEGLGSSLLWVKWALDIAIVFDLEPIFIGPMIAGHGMGDIGNVMGITNNPTMTIHDPEAFENAVREKVPFPGGLDGAWFREQDNSTDVIYEVDVRGITVPQATRRRDWGKPALPPNPNSRVCRYARQALRNMYWSAPRIHGKCRTFLPDDNYLAPERNVHQSQKRSWVLAVHVRRGDVVRIGKRVTPHADISAAVKSALRGIAATDPAARVVVLVFSEGPSGMSELQLLDEHGKPITWDIQRESCLDVGLHCRQKIILKASTINTFDCLAAADVVIGSASSLSEAAAALSTNVKVMLWQNQTEQDRITFNPEAVASLGAVSSDEQSQMDAAISDWWQCLQETRKSTGSDAGSLAASRFYKTVHD